MSDRYNGWPNYETWCVSLWITNDEGLYHQAARWVSLADEEEFRHQVTEYVYDTTYGDNQDVPANLGSDLLGHALARVDWYYLYQSLREEETVE